jgi:cysteine desulfurase
MNPIIYLDYASTTPVDPRVAEKMMQCLTLDGNFGNPASRSHRLGWMAEEAVDIGRNQIADLINADPREIVFTSGATESDNLAIKGAAFANTDKGRHLITMTTEHKAVLDVFAYLEHQGFSVTYLKPRANGLVNMDELQAALRDDTSLVSIMHVNNEIGVVQDIAAIGALCHQNGTLFHVDAAQSLGKLTIDISQLPVDLMSICAHKCYGPKGIGALYVRRRPKVTIAAQIHGGGHERGMRSGTLATHQIVGMGEACAIAGREMSAEAERIRQLKETLWQGIEPLGNVYRNGDATQSVAGILNVSFGQLDGESLIMGLNTLAVSSGSACTSASLEPSYVLTEIGRSSELAHAGIRFSIGRFTTAEDISAAIKKIVEVVSRLRHAGKAKISVE